MHESDTATAPPPCGAVAATLEQTGSGGAKANAAPIRDVSAGAPTMAVWPSDASATLVPKAPKPISPPPDRLLLLRSTHPADRVNRKRRAD